MMAPRLSISIAAHEKRENLVWDLVDRLRLARENALTWWTIAWDRDDDEWDTHRRAWSKWPATSTHHLVLQDDALPCRNLIPGLEQWVLPYIGDRPISLYFGNALSHPKILRATRQANDNNASWIVSSGVWWGVAVLLPVSLIQPMLEFCSPRRELYDRRLTIWCENRELLVYYPWPSLVEHRDEPSLVNPGRRPGRTAVNFAGEDFSALDFNPTGPVVPCGRVSSALSTRIIRKIAGED
jgi:hypothetical protein